MLTFIKNRKQSHTHTRVGTMQRQKAGRACWINFALGMKKTTVSTVRICCNVQRVSDAWRGGGVGRINHNHHHYQCHPHVINTLEEQTSLFMPFLFLPSNLYVQLPHEAKTMLKWLYVFIYYSAHIQEDESHLLVPTCSACMLFPAIFGHICIAAFAHTMLLGRGGGVKFLHSRDCLL